MFRFSQSKRSVSGEIRKSWKVSIALCLFSAVDFGLDSIGTGVNSVSNVRKK